MRRILFICWANCVRSQMAEAILTFRGGNRFEAFSAGAKPSGFVHAYTLKVLGEMNLRGKGLRSKSWKEFQDKPLDAVITLCGHAKIVIDQAWPPPDEGALPLRIHWELEDPMNAEVPGRVITTDEHVAAFRETRDEIRECIEMLTIAPQTTLDDDLAFQELLEQIGEIED